MAFFFAEFLFLLILAGSGMANECAPVRCGESGPWIRFPFWLRDHQPETCGYPGFELTCPRINDTRFEVRFSVRASTTNLNNILLPMSVQSSVLEIDYKSQLIQVNVLNASCPPKQLQPDMSASDLTFPFEKYDSFRDNFTFFNCSTNYRKQNSNYGALVTCLSGHDYDVFAFRSYYSVFNFPIASCWKMYDISDALSEMTSPFEINDYTQVWLHWSKPSCSVCEAKGNYCMLNNNITTGEETYCLAMPGQPSQKRGRGVSKSALAIGFSISLSLLLLIVVSSSGFILLKEKKEDRKRVGNFLEDYKAHRLAKFSYSDIKKMTSQFREILGQGSYGTTYKGKLINDLVVAVKVLKSSGGSSEEFVGKLVKMDGIQHMNVVRLIGYSAEGNKRALVYEFLPNGSLENFIASGKQNKSLEWKELSQIATGLARGIDYLHQGCNQQILHLGIQPRNVLLDHSYNPRLTDYGIPKLCSKEQILLSMGAEQFAVAYNAPEVLSSNFENATPKSDVYSFGILILEIVGRKDRKKNAAEPRSQPYLPEWMYNQMNASEGQLAFQTDGEEDSMIKTKLMVVGLWCTKWYPSDRPSMEAVIRMLEGKDMPVVPPNLFGSTKPLVSA